VLQRSDERRAMQGGETAARGQDRVTQLVRNAYLAVLHREPMRTACATTAARVVRTTGARRTSRRLFATARSTGSRTAEPARPTLLAGRGRIAESIV